MKREEGRIIIHTVMICRKGERIKSNPVHIADHEPVLLLRFRIVATTHVDDILLDVFLDYKPRSTAEIQALTLTDGMEPEALMRAKDLACL